MQKPLTDEQRSLLADRVWAYTKFDHPQRTKFENCVKVMFGERRWEGHRDFPVTDEMRLTIAGKASLMLLGASNYYFQTVTTILIYPRVIARSRDGHTTRTVGEAWPTGGILLCWPEIIADSISNRGRNVVVHEFAHHLDGLDGEMGGSIPFPKRADEARWHDVSHREYQRLVAAAERGQATLFDKYGSHNLAEFFAVASECFFEQPVEMRQMHEELYDLLRVFYQLDPAVWRQNL